MLLLLNIETCLILLNYNYKVESLIWAVSDQRIKDEWRDKQLAVADRGRCLKVSHDVMETRCASHFRRLITQKAVNAKPFGSIDLLSHIAICQHTSVVAWAFLKKVAIYYNRKEFSFCRWRHVILPRPNLTQTFVHIEQKVRMLYGLYVSIWTWIEPCEARMGGRLMCLLEQLCKSPSLTLNWLDFTLIS